MLDIQNYKVRKEFEGYTIDCYSNGCFAYEVELVFAVSWWFYRCNMVIKWV